jgi:hypothetical protein
MIRITTGASSGRDGRDVTFIQAAPQRPVQAPGGASPSPSRSISIRRPSLLSSPVVRGEGGTPSRRTSLKNYTPNPRLYQSPTPSIMASPSQVGSLRIHNFETLCALTAMHRPDGIAALMLDHHKGNVENQPQRAKQITPVRFRADDVHLAAAAECDSRQHFEGKAGPSRRVGRREYQRQARISDGARQGHRRRTHAVHHFWLPPRGRSAQVRSFLSPGGSMQDKRCGIYPF